MPKVNYTPLFEQFWKAYPRKTAKTTAFKAWIKQGIEDDAFMPKQAIQDCEKRTRLQWWPRDRSKIPHGATWINQMRWEDEGWEDEIKTREDEKPNTGLPTIKPPQDDGPKLSGWETMCNRLCLSYLRHAGGFSDERFAQFKATKKRVIEMMVPAINEELAGITDRDELRRIRGEMAQTFAETLMNSLDMDLNLNLGSKVIRMARRKAA